MNIVDLTTNRSALTAALVLARAAPASAQGVPDGAKVRIVASGLPGGWLDGKVQMNKSSGCTMVNLDRKQPGGYTMVALNSVGGMERPEGCLGRRAGEAIACEGEEGMPRRRERLIRAS